MRIPSDIDSRPGPGAPRFPAGRALPTCVRTLSPISTSSVAVAKSHPFEGAFTRLSDSALRAYEWSHMCRLRPYEGMWWGGRLDGDVQDAVLPALEGDQVSAFNRRTDVRDSQVIAVQIMCANRSSDHV